MNRSIVLFTSIFKKRWLEFIRYPVDMVSGIITLYVIFLAIFFGYKAVGSGSENFGSTVDGLTVGFMLWMFSISGYSTFSWSLMEEARIGTLEQLYMTRLGFGKLCIFRVIAGFFFDILFVVPIVFLMMLTTGRYLHINVMSLTPLFIFTVAAPYGIGFVAGGIALIFKQIRSLFQVVQFIFIGFIAAPVTKLPLLKILPLSLGTSLIKQVMANDISITQIPPTDLVLLALNGAFYFGSGFFIFKICEKIARRRGLLGHY